MKRAAKLFLCSRMAIRCSVQPARNHSQVFSFSRFSNPPVSRFQSSNQRLLFSSNTESLLEILSSADWLQNLEDSKLKLTHESAMYVLKNLNQHPMKAADFLKWAVDKHGFEPSSSIYSLLLRIYCNKDSLKEFWITIKEMKEKGYHIDQETYRTIFSMFRGLKMENEATALKHFYSRLVKESAVDDKVNEVADMIKGSEWGEELETKLSQMNLIVTDNIILRMMKELRGKGYSLKSYKFFIWVDECLGFKHNSVTYNGILRVLCWKESITEFWNVIQNMIASGFEIDIDTYVKVSRQLQKSKMMNDAVKLYEHMMNSSYKPSLNECNYLLRSLATCDNPDLDLVYRVVKTYEEAGNLLTKNVYDGIHRSLTSVGKFEQADEVVKTMRNAGYEPDNITYSQLIFGLCKAHRFDEAANVLDVMKEQGCNPDIMTWTILIKWYCQANETDKAMLYFSKMMENSFDPDGDLLDVVINGLLHQSRSLDAFKLTVELVQNVRLKPWQATYKNLIQELVNERRLEEALELLRMMKKQNYPTFTEPFVRYISKFGSVDDAAEFLSALSLKEYPTVSSYQHLLKSFFNEGRHSEARDLLFKCPHHVRKHPSVCSLFGSAT